MVYGSSRSCSNSALVYALFFFFFQAEDGIRDLIVTGVQTCALPIYLSDGSARRALFADLDRRANRILILTEGLLIYLSAEEVAALAEDLAACAHFQRWIMDLASPGLLRMMQRTTGKKLSAVGAPFKFGPAEGPAFFLPHAWEPIDVKGLLKTATRFKRPPFFLRLLARLPEQKGPAGNRPWSGVCLFKKR